MFGIDGIKMIEDFQTSNFFRARVLSVDDPLKINRIQLNIFGMTDDIPSDCLPWCELLFHSGVITYSSVNDIIWLYFENRDIFRPVYLGTIYVGKNLDVSAVLSTFLESHPVNDESAYKIALHKANNIVAADKLIAKDTHQTFMNVIVAPDANAFSKVYAGEESQKGVSDGGKPVVGSTFYPWYHQDEDSTVTTWKDTMGGWSYYTEAQLLEGLAKFPDNFKSTAYKRYVTWVKGITTYGIDKVLLGGLPKEMQSRDKSWKFVATLPWMYYDPTMVSTFDSTTVGGGVESFPLIGYLPSFPFGKMKIKNRDYYKQHTFLSHDGKSAIELDDNDNYERLRLDFNYGEMGLEFSKAGMNGVELWTTGTFRIHANGTNSDGKGGTVQNTNYISCLDSELYITTGRDMVISNTGGAYIESDGVSIKSGAGVLIAAKDGINFASSWGCDNLGKSEAPNPLSPASKIWFGKPMLQGPGKHLEGMDSTGWYLNFDTTTTPTLDDAMKKLLVLTNVIAFVQALVKVGSSMPAMIGLKYYGLKGIADLCEAYKDIINESEWDPTVESIAINHLAASWNKILMEGSST